eukprot:TRINITY_DN10228_c0_g1_i1.p1 TRINITY_DN10228_c0_g1~~TRINITY_DN10228_c0_g1_i1.p1  ORF type:complete len:443 (-),score=69.29 TRINITY_DN10228_c0_g1_i1:95-1423(-)
MKLTLTPSLQIGRDFVVQVDIAHLLEGDWLGLYLVDQSDAEWGSHWYHLKQQRSEANLKNSEISSRCVIHWDAAYGPWVEGQYQFRHFTKDDECVNKSEIFHVPRFDFSEYPFPPLREKKISSVSSLRVISFNAWESGTQTKNGVLGIVSLILEQQPHLVGFQEMNLTTATVLKAILGTQYHCIHSTEGKERDCEDTRHDTEAGGGHLGRIGKKKKSSWSGGFILSSLPVVSVIPSRPGVWGSGVVVEVATSSATKKLGFFNTHLTAYPYGPYQILDRDVEDVINECTKVQGAEIEAVYSNIISKEGDIGLILVGDHNIPSNIDGQVTDPLYHLYRSSLDMKARNVVMDWPVSLFLQKNGFVDSWRELYPDVTRESHLSYGFTWSTLSEPKDIYDRIDFVYYRNATDFSFVPKHGYLVDKLASSFVPYPSDHRMVVIDLLIQ